MFCIFGRTVGATLKEGSFANAEFIQRKGWRKTTLHKLNLATFQVYLQKIGL